MTLFSQIGSLPYPSLSDAPNAQTAGAALTTALDLVTLPQFSSLAALTAAIPSPADGQRAVRTDLSRGGTECRWSTNSARWIPQLSLISEHTLANSTTSTVSFSSIPQEFSHLRVIIDGGCATSTQSHKYGVECCVQINGDTNQNNYSFVGWNQLDKYNGGVSTYQMDTTDATGGTTSPGPIQNWLIRQDFPPDVGARLGLLPGESMPSVWGVIDATFPDYRNTSGTLSQSMSNGMNVNTSGNSYSLGSEYRTGWNGNTAITSMAIGLFAGAKYRINTTFRLYGF